MGDFDTPAVLKDVTQHSGRIFTYRFTPAKPMSFQPGQYLSLIAPGGIPTPLSIASSPSSEDIEFAVEITGGPKTSRIKLLKPGDEVVLRGPFGRFTYAGEKRVCFIAGGVGITPLMSMLRSIAEGRDGVHATMVYSCRTTDEVLWLDELQRMAALPDITVYITVTRETPKEWQHSTGRITPEIIKNIVPHFRDTAFYCCGSKEMMASVKEMLTSIGVPAEQVKREQW